MDQAAHIPASGAQPTEADVERELMIGLEQSLAASQDRAKDAKPFSIDDVENSLGAIKAPISAIFSIDDLENRLAAIKVIAPHGLSVSDFEDELNAALTLPMKIEEVLKPVQFERLKPEVQARARSLVLKDVARAYEEAAFHLNTFQENPAVAVRLLQEGKQFVAYHNLASIPEGQSLLAIDFYNPFPLQRVTSRAPRPPTALPI